MVFIPRAVLLAFLTCALLLTIRLGVAEAEFRRDPERALRFPRWLRAANLVRPDASRDKLRLAVELNPRLSLAWMYLGLATEDGSPAADRQAEEALLEAARVDRQYLPAWTLANFYFRRGDAEKFWPWAERAAALTFDDYRPLLRLAETFGQSPERVAMKLGGGPRLLRAYLDLLIGQGRLDAAQEIGQLLAAYHDPSDRARFEDLAARRRR